MRDLERFLASGSRWIAPATVLTALVIGATAGLGPALLVLAGGVLLGAVLLLWSSLGRLTGESPLTLEEAVGLAAPSPEEERKRSILRALKDLEYERSVGKISEDDFAELSARYRSEAKTLLRALEAELAPRREKAEAKLRARLEQEGVVGTGGVDKAKKKKHRGAPPAPKDEAPEAPVAASPGGVACASCKTPNDGDARFCKRCGAALGAAEATS